MTTSGVFTLTNTANDIVTAALRKCGAIDVEQDLQTADINTGLSELNRLVKYLQTKGANLWKEEEGVLFLDVGKTSYSLGPTGDECCDSDDFVSSTLSADEALGQTILSITSTTGMTAADYIGIELDDSTRQWTTIVSVDSPTQVTVTASLTGAAASGNTIYTFTSLIPRPLAVIGEMSRFQTTVSAEQVPIRRWSREEYYNQTNKTSTGDVVNDYYQPLLTNGQYIVWQPSNTVKGLVRFTYQKPIEVFSTTANSPDFPAEWYLPLVFKLAEVIGPEYKITPEKFAMIKSNAAEYMAEVFGFDQDMAPLQLVPE